MKWFFFFGVILLNFVAIWSDGIERSNIMLAAIFNILMAIFYQRESK